MDPAAFVYMALSGENEFGRCSGAVIVDTAHCHAKFTLLADIQPHSVSMQLSQSMTADPSNLYILHTTNDHMHVFAYPRDRAMQQLKDGLLPTLAAPPR